MSTTQHPLTETDAAKITDEVCNLVEEFGDLIDDVSTWGPDDEVRMLPKLHKIRAALSAALAVAPPAEPLARTLLAVPEGYGAPHHDEARVEADDFVARVDEDGLVHAGIAHYKDGDGDWRAKNGCILAWADERADRPDAITVWPAPTPPAEEVELPTEFGAVITDVEDWNGATYDRLAFLGLAFEDSVDKVHPDELTAFTLPDGTRVRRDGEYENGEPRFVKVREEEK